MSAKIFYQEEALEDCQNFIREHNFSRIFFLADENTHDHCLIPLLRELRDLPEMEILEVEAGEESKSIEVLQQLWLALSELGADRHSLLINVGGGVISDLGGFLAATYMRGIPFINFPTSLLAQVDASVGGKTGINLDGLKNRVGLFCEAERVYIINEFLDSLPVRELRSGYAEMLKHALLSGSSHWEAVRQLDISGEIPPFALIETSVNFKKSVVKQDFQESGLRKILNFGHSIGHALESGRMQSDEPLLHGEAIALGMLGELWLSEKYCGLPSTVREQYLSVFKKTYGDLQMGAVTPELISLIDKDKKNRGTALRFCLLQDVGKPVYDREVSPEDVEAALQYVAAQ